MSYLCTELIGTPIGPMQAVASAKGLCALEFLKEDRQLLLKNRLNRWFAESRLEWESHPFIDDAKKWLEAYFSGRFEDLMKIPMDLRGTPFELSIWKELCKIKLGQTISYSDLATSVGRPKGARAAGGASRRNPLCLIVPCHRVIGAGGQLTGYGGGLERKEYLIRLEVF